MKYLKIFALLVLSLSWTVPTIAQEKTTEDIASPKLDLFQDLDGATGIIFLYEGSMKVVTSVHFGVGSCEHTFTVRMKTNAKGERAIFIPDPERRLSFAEGYIYVDKMPANAMRVSRDDTAEGYQ